MIIKKVYLKFEAQENKTLLPMMAFEDFQDALDSKGHGYVMVNPIHLMLNENGTVSGNNFPNVEFIPKQTEQHQLIPKTDGAFGTGGLIPINKGRGSEVNVTITQQG